MSSLFVSLRADGSRGKVWVEAGKSGEERAGEEVEGGGGGGGVGAAGDDGGGSARTSGGSKNSSDTMVKTVNFEKIIEFLGDVEMVGFAAVLGVL